MADTAISDKTDAIASLMKGAVDLHCHSGPSTMPRLVDHIQAVEQASEAGMRAVVFKDHYYATGPIAEMLNARFPQLKVQAIGSIVLNNAVGGFNVHAVESALMVGARIVWSPTVSAANHLRAGHRKRLLPTKEKMRDPIALSPIDNRGRVMDEVKEVLDAVAQYDAVFSAGHLHISEVWPLFDEAKKRGVKRLLVNHPTYILGGNTGDIKELVGMGAMIEHSICMLIDCPSKKYAPAELKTFIDAAGVDHTFFGSDLGQAKNPSPVTGFRTIIGILLDLGYSHEDISKMVGSNGASLVGLGANA
jgi:hypothetical protein